jgi:hypothetical protein
MRCAFVEAARLIVEIFSLKVMVNVFVLISKPVRPSAGERLTKTGGVPSVVVAVSVFTMV